jgi:hypothetical protein
VLDASLGRALGVVPSPACGGGIGRGYAERLVLLAPSPPLPRKRGREQTEFAARIASCCSCRCCSRLIPTPPEYILPPNFTRPISFPRRVFALGFCFFASLTPVKGWRSAERRTDACEASVGPALSGQARHLARRLASPYGGRPPPGARRMPPDDAPSMSKLEVHIASDANRVKIKMRFVWKFFCVVIPARRLYLSYWRPLEIAGRGRIPLIPAHSASKTRVNALVLGIQGPQSAALGSRFRGGDGPEVCERTKKPHADMR